PGPTAGLSRSGRRALPPADRRAPPQGRPPGTTEPTARTHPCRPPCRDRRVSPTRYGDAMSKDRRDQPIALSRIYTRTGADAPTPLGDMSRVPKTDPRLVAYADVDEANCAIGAALALAELGEDVTSLLARVQNELFDVGADLCNPVTESPPYPP